MADFNGDLTPIIDFVGVTFRDAKDQEGLELWRQAEFDYSRSPDRMGPDDYYLRVGLRASASRRLGVDLLTLDLNEPGWQMDRCWLYSPAGPLPDLLELQEEFGAG